MYFVSFLVVALSSIALSYPANDSSFCSFVDQSPHGPQPAHPNPFQIVASSEDYTSGSEITGKIKYIY